MRTDYQTWLREQRYNENTISNQLSRVKKVEEAYGQLDESIRNGTIDEIIKALNYTTEDERRGRPNPSRINIQGNIRNGLQSYKNAVAGYQRFVASSDLTALSDIDQVAEAVAELSAETEVVSRGFSLERDMQRAIRDDIRSVGSELRIIDDGMERVVSSGRIDITCEDVSDNSLVVIELKAGKADSRAIAQILGYMGDVYEDEEPRRVKGILIAHDFDRRARSAAKMVPGLQLLTYAIRFDFRPVSDE